MAASRRPSIESVASQCFSKVGGHANHSKPNVRRALDYSRGRCKGQTGRGYGACMDANYRAGLIKYAQTELQHCGSTLPISGLCTYRGCNEAIRREISLWLQGKNATKVLAAEREQRKAQTSEMDAIMAAQNLPANAPAETKKPAVKEADDYSFIEAPETTQTQQTQESFFSKKAMGIPVWMLGVGAAGAAYFFVFRKKS